MIVLGPAWGAGGTCTSSNSSWDTARMVKASADISVIDIFVVYFLIYLHTPIQNPNSPRPVREFRMR